MLGLCKYPGIVHGTLGLPFLAQILVVSGRMYAIKHLALARIIMNNYKSSHIAFSVKTLVDSKHYEVNYRGRKLISITSTMCMKINQQ